ATSCSGIWPTASCISPLCCGRILIAMHWLRRWPGMPRVIVVTAVCPVPASDKKIAAYPDHHCRRPGAADRRRHSVVADCGSCCAVCLADDRRCARMGASGAPATGARVRRICCIVLCAGGIVAAGRPSRPGLAGTHACVRRLPVVAGGTILVVALSARL